MMTTYNPVQAEQGVLYPCHGIVIQFGIQNENELCCHMHQRSADWVLGEPFNIASYALLMNIICELVNNDCDVNSKLTLGKLSMSFGDTHIYEEHIEVAKEQIKRDPYSFPTLKITKKLTELKDLVNFKFTDIQLIDYNCHGPLKATMIA
jgi:thymidylate synthase